VIGSGWCIEDVGGGYRPCERCERERKLKCMFLYKPRVWSFIAVRDEELEVLSIGCCRLVIECLVVWSQCEDLSIISRVMRSCTHQETLH